MAELLMDCSDRHCYRELMAELQCSDRHCYRELMAELQFSDRALLQGING